MKCGAGFEGEHDFGLEIEELAQAMGDLVFVASLFVLGGDFWDKVRALFVHDANVGQEDN